MIQRPPAWEEVVRSRNLKKLPEWVEAVPLFNYTEPSHTAAALCGQEVDAGLVNSNSASGDAVVGVEIDDDRYHDLSIVLTSGFHHIDISSLRIVRLRKRNWCRLRSKLTEEEGLEDSLVWPEDTKLVLKLRSSDMPTNPRRCERLIALLLEMQITHVALLDHMTDSVGLFWTYVAFFSVWRLCKRNVRLACHSVGLFPFPWTEVLYQLTSGKYTDRTFASVLTNIGSPEQLRTAITWRDWEPLVLASRLTQRPICTLPVGTVQAWYSHMIAATDLDALPFKFACRRPNCADPRQQCTLYTTPRLGRVTYCSAWLSRHLSAGDYNTLKNWNIGIRLPISR